MTEEQRRLSLHCHLLVWVFGYNDFASFRKLMDKTPERYAEFAEFLDRVIFNQVATLGDVNLAMSGVRQGEPGQSDADHEPLPPDPLMRDPKECLPVAPPTACFPRGGEDPCPHHDSAFARLMYLDLASLTTGANLHKCQATCHKYNHKDSGRFGFGKEGKDLVLDSTVVPGRASFDTRRNMTVNGVVYPIGDNRDSSDAEGVAARQAFTEAFDPCLTHAADGDTEADTDTDRFSVVFRRAHTHINFYNPIIQYCTRSNMDLKVMLREGDAKGLLFYILNYSTETEQTLDVLLPLLVPVVERIREESGGAPAKDLAVRLVRSCLCRQLSSLSIGGPAAVSKIFDLPDAKIYHPTVPCPMGPLLACATSVDGPLDGDGNNSNRNDNGNNDSSNATDRNDIGNDDSSDNNDNVNDGDDSNGAIIVPVNGKLTVTNRTHALYRDRCDPDDTSHPLHGMSYFVWTRLVRVGRLKPAASASTISASHGPDSSDSEPDGDDTTDDVSAPSATTKRGRPRSTRHLFVGQHRSTWQQVVRDSPAMLNIMRDVPRQDTQPVAHSRLVLCMFVPFFDLDDLRLPNESWPAAHARVESTGSWDSRTKPFRNNIAGILTQRLAADDESARRRAECPETDPSNQMSDDVQGDVFGGDYTDDHDLSSVLPMSAWILRANIFVSDALDAFLRAGFGAVINVLSTMSTLLCSRPPEDAARDIARIKGSDGSRPSSTSMALQQAALEDKAKDHTLSVAASAASSPSLSVPAGGWQCDPAVMDPYLLRLRTASEQDLSLSARRLRNCRRDTTNAAVALTDVGATSASQHPAVFQIAQEFGLNRKQRIAYYVTANGLFSYQRSDGTDTLRLYVGGGAGTGKSHVLMAIKALIECPAVIGRIPSGRLLTVAFQGKQAASVGGTTVHSVCESTRGRGGGNLSGAHDDQAPLPAKKAVHWNQVSVLAIEEVSMVGCNLLVDLHKAACSMFPSHKEKPFGNRILLMFGDFNQLSPVKAASLACGSGKASSRRGMTLTQQYGADLFRQSNAAVLLDEDNNRFSKVYAPIMDRLLLGEGTLEDVALLNTRVLDGSDNFCASRCYGGRVIAFRNRVTNVLTLPMMRTWSEANGTPLFISPSSDLWVGDERVGRSKIVST
ncbi:unnamed protein product [Laminaria digitata]